ncbi:MAG: rhomboid family intramembrane serine protease [Verrucomicrobia bacterium]|nr:rhomboid family intramembrane serine protease [Verrucomicrobiota bacterium]
MINPTILFEGELNPSAVFQGAIWQLFTAMFLHYSVSHIGLNMLSLFFIGPFTEAVYGSGRYLVLYLFSGIIGNITSLFFLPAYQAAGASTAIFGVFGALGIFLVLQYRKFGSAVKPMLMQWVFWLVLNLVYGFNVSGIDVAGHIGGLATGLILGGLFLRQKTY